MLEYPEVKTVAAQLNASVKGAAVASVLPPSKAHKFCWYNGDPKSYGEKLAGSVISGAEGFATSSCPSITADGSASTTE